MEPKSYSSRDLVKYYLVTRQSELVQIAISVCKIWFSYHWCSFYSCQSKNPNHKDQPRIVTKPQGGVFFIFLDYIDLLKRLGPVIPRCP